MVNIEQPPLLRLRCLWRATVHREASTADSCPHSRTLLPKLNFLMTRPTFSHPVFDQLYARDYFIDDSVLREVLALGPATAVPELLKILDAALEDYHAGKLAETNWLETYYFHHALYLLHELQAPEAFDVYRRLLRLPAAGTDFWFGDNLFEEVPTMLAHAAQTRLPELLALLDDPQLLLMHRLVASEAMSRLLHEQPAQRPAALTFLQPHLQRIIADPARARALYPADTVDYSYALEDYLGGLLADLQEASLRELEPEMRELHRLGLVDESMTGGADAIEFDKNRLPRLLPNIFALYQQQRDDPESYSPFHPDAAGIAQRRAEQEAKYARLRQEALARQFPQPRTVPPKIGRNDPCPCGSGQKYKKCHGA